MQTLAVQNIGFPKMDKEEGEKRDFLPEFFAALSAYPVNIYLEKGYGEKLGYDERDYLRANPAIAFVEREQVFKQQLVVVIRSPEFPYIGQMNPESGLLAMLHYETRPFLFDLLKKKKINAFSLDGIVNDQMQRMVVTYEMTALGGVHTSFEKFKQMFKDGLSLAGQPLKVTVLGMGNLGIQAARYAIQQYNENRFEKYGIAGIRIEFMEKEVTSHHETVSGILKDTDLLIDATRRPDPTQIIINNDLIQYLPKHAIILDLTADPYEERESGMQVKAIEGIPHGNLDQYVFDADEEACYRRIPAAINTTHRRTTVSCNAWPGVMARECMDIYGNKIMPFLEWIIHKGFHPDIHSDLLEERALARSTMTYFEKNHLAKNTR